MSRARVLLADPDLSHLASLGGFLAREGFQVKTATDGLDCLAKLRGFKPDVLVLEPELLWGGGEGILTLMYQEADVPYVPVVVLSSRPDPEGLRQVGIYPVSDYLVKPIRLEEVADRVRAILKRRRVARRVRYATAGRR